MVRGKKSRMEVEGEGGTQEEEVVGREMRVRRAAFDKRNNKLIIMGFILQGMLYKPSCYSSCSSNVTGEKI